ncbi:Epoxide hydrolase 3 [Datura stramonium]|uniref:Epoxide hydrolase 3 n=1 Tax=Datura stramonium TaxID=4076 RepID=A0ABS8S7J9_DATST|nr:Epoxide hydrolase 3 [Datura stramonium]
MEKIEHKMVGVYGINMHIAELGQGPTVLFLHGFPELWYSWRHQIVYLAEHGYHAVAPDLRGYGDTTGAPINDPSKFSVLHLVGDIVALLEAIAPNEDKVFVVGHDWGAYIAWHLCLFRPDKVKALVNLSVHYFPRNPQMNLVEGLKTLYGEDHYVWRFQVAGEIEAEFAPFGAKSVLKKFLTYRDPAPFCFPKGKGLEAVPDAPIALSSWLSEEELDYYASKFEQTGFTGGVNYYRAFPLNWELTAPWTGAQVKVPTKFIVGEFDLVYHIPGAKEYIHNGGFKKDVPLLEEVVVLEGAAHFVNQERPDEISKHIYDFIQKF